MEWINPLRWFSWVGEFFRVWFLNIPWRDAPKAIPAIILSIALFTTGFIAFSEGAGWRNRLMERQLQLALDHEDYPTAEIVLLRQLKSDPGNADLLYRYALIRDEQSFPDQARVLMRRLLGQKNIHAAKWMLSQEYLANADRKLDEEKLAEYEFILDVIHKREPKNVIVENLYANLLIQTQKYVKALPLLESLSKLDPRKGLLAAAISRRLGDELAAEQYAEKALEAVTSMAKDDPADVGLAMAVARNQAFLNRFPEAYRTLDRSAQSAKTPEERNVLVQSLGDLIVEWVNDIEESPHETLKDRVRVLRMLQAALRFAPNNPRVVSMTADHVLATLGEDSKELETVREALVNGSAPGIAHFIRGTSALMKKDLKKAEFELSLAAEMMPRSGAILNNLAVTMAMQEEPDYEKALEVANGAIEQVANPTPHFFETRGQILFQMGRFKSAIPDLERAVADPSLADKAHEMLANCYDELGDKDLADGHRKAMTP